MTDYGPAQGPQGPTPATPPPAYGPPPTYGPPSSYAPPSGYGPPPESRPSFEAKSVNPLDWVTIGAGLLALVFSFFAYYGYEATAFESAGECRDPSSVPAEGRGILSDLCGGATASAWHGFFGWFGVLLGLLAAGLVTGAVLVGPAKESATTRVLAFGAAGLGVVSTLIALLVIPDWPELQDFVASVGGSFSSSDYDKSIDNGPGFSYWIVLVLLAVIAAATFQRYRQTSGADRRSFGPPPATPPGYVQAPDPPDTTPQQPWAPPPPPAQW